MNKEQFAEKIIRLRKKKGYTQAQLAELLNVSNKAVSRWETAEGYPDITLLKPLSEALGISCDELLGDSESYSDLSRYDLQRYLPYALTLLALLLYYIFLKLQISQLLAFAAFLGMTVFSFVLMIQHTDKKGLPALTRWNLLLVYFPLTSFLQFLYLLYVITQFGVTNILEMMAASSMEQLDPINFLNGFGTGLRIYLLIYVMVFILLLFVYICLRHQFIMRYDISWRGLQKKLYTKQQEEQRFLFRKWTEKGERILRILLPLAAIVTLTVIFAYLYREYRLLIEQFEHTIPPDYGANDYALMVSKELLNSLQGKLLLLLLASCLLQGLAAVKSKRALHYIGNICGFFMYMVITIFFTGIVDRYFIKLPFVFVIPAGLLLILWYCRELIRKNIKKRQKTV
ncbi:helix-turn-helix domain-containing protein [[Clostridium] innocuum]|nr:helix-turn-helix domain-containing protein [[Clostridium] innocuum]